ncbi:unnamed protein product [Ranitomeya imitator]|uniref:Uncharacterized protein n=1 Tax=Ranitomeya imitator TaxID=111125 RepID=A0ABN9MFJ6_9NEOB|nr:unnamed protein product [Ranitomeya imitator]
MDFSQLFHTDLLHIFPISGLLLSNIEFQNSQKIFYQVQVWLDHSTNLKCFLKGTCHPQKRSERCWREDMNGGFSTTYQTNAVNNLSVAFLMWNIVSTVLYFSNTEENFDSLQEVIDFLQLNQNFSIKDFTKNHGFYINNRTLLKCNFFGIPCYPEDFKHVFTEYGNCYTFNQDPAKPHKRVSSSGRGLSVLFDIKQTEFTDDPSLGYVDAGIIFVIHSPKIPPRFDGLGLHCPAGMHAHASIRHFKVFTYLKEWKLEANMTDHNTEEFQFLPV